MLTSDLLRASVKQGWVQPGYLPVEGAAGERFRERAQALIDAFLAHVGARRAVLDEALEEQIAGRPDFKIDRGLVKLLEDRATFSGLSSSEAAERRSAVFRAAARAREAGGFEREAVLGAVALALEVAPALLEQQLYGDLKENEVLEALPPLAPAALIDRYNLALAQAVLLRALKLEVTVTGAPPPRLRQLLRHVKFHGLLTDARREGETIRLELDGPMSIFTATPRYGVKMAGFLPALLLCEDWSLHAEVQLGKGRHRRKFALTPAAGLRTHARDAGAWLPELVEAFAGRFAEVAPGWSVDTQVELFNVAGEVIVPDFRFVHDASGWVGYLEVLGYWRKGGVARRLTALSQPDAPRIVLALEQKLKLGKANVKAIKGPVVPFRELPDARKVRKQLEALREADAEGPA